MKKKKEYKSLKEIKQTQKKSKLDPQNVSWLNMKYFFNEFLYHNQLKS